MSRARTRIRLAIALAIGLSALPGRSLAADKPQVWVAFGDSITASQKWPWTDILARETGNIVINSGHNRSTTRDALPYLESDVLSHTPDLVFIMFGVNDQQIANGSLPGYQRVPPEEFARNLDTMVTRVQAIGAKVVLMTNRPLIQGPGPPGLSLYLDRNGERGALYPTPGRTKDSIRQYNAIVREIARKRGTYLVDIWQAVVDKAGSDSDGDVMRVGLERPVPLLDGVHLGPGGARFYADTIMAAMPFR